MTSKVLQEGYLGRILLFEEGTFPEGKREGRGRAKVLDLRMAINTGNYGACGEGTAGHRRG